MTNSNHKIDNGHHIGINNHERNHILFPASVRQYEVEPIAPMLGNLTCNPGIVYDLFINNPKANAGGKFKTRDEVMAELGRILGPGCDISVELNNPFEKDFDKILKECETFKKILRATLINSSAKRWYSETNRGTQNDLYGYGIRRTEAERKTGEVSGLNGPLDTVGGV
jgi:hypothetical protein